MTKTNLFVILILIILGAFGYWLIQYMQSTNNGKVGLASSSNMNEATSLSSTSSISTTRTGIYTVYSPAAVTAATEQKKVLFFHASWCPSCRQQDNNLNLSKEQIPSNTAIFKVDFDTAIDLRQKYGVTLQHTFVQIDGAGNELQQWNSLYKQNNLESILARLIN